MKFQANFFICLKVLEALTTENCSEQFSLERLELLGDSFLKFAVSSQLFVRHSEAHEGFLSSERIKKICNLSLYMLGSNYGLPVCPLCGSYKHLFVRISIRLNYQWVFFLCRMS